MDDDNPCMGAPLDKIIEGLRDWDDVRAYAQPARRLEECRALLQRLANDEPAPEGETFQSWAKELLA